MKNILLSKTRIATGIMLMLPSMVFAGCGPQNLPETTPNSRFIINGDNTVSDLKTGLIWKRCNEGRSTETCAIGADFVFNWQGALDRATYNNNLPSGFADAKNWRLPNVKELASLVEKACYSPAINDSIFPRTSVNNKYWTSTHNASFTFSSTDVKTQAWALDFKDGHTTAIDKTSEVTKSLVRLVRSTN